MFSIWQATPYIRGEQHYPAVHWGQLWSWSIAQPLGLHELHYTNFTKTTGDKVCDLREFCRGTVEVLDKRTQQSFGEVADISGKFT